MRLVSVQLANAFQNGQPINFGLYFNKMLPYWEHFSYSVIKENKKKGTKETTVTETLKPKAGDQKTQNEEPPQSPFLQFNPEYLTSCNSAKELLKQRHIQQAAYCRAMEQVGWRAFIIHARLSSSFVSGLGMAHPTETGLALDHTSGLPYIPAASQKGVLRLAHLINSLCDENGKWVSEEALERLGIVFRKNGDLHWNEDSASKTLFGAGGDKEPLAGQLVILDAYPLTPPVLGEEILNPHFKDYYEGKRPPTEDQSPVPIKFLVVKQGAEFVFRLLLRQSFASAQEKDQEKLADFIEKNLRRAIREEGIGAKTALGFGRFAIIGKGEPESVTEWQRKQQEEEELLKYPWRPAARKIEAAGDWGQLKQLLENAEVQAYQSQSDVGRAVAETASCIRKNNLKKWESTRDNMLAEWLRPSGIPWESCAAPVGDNQDSLTLEEQAAMTGIERLSEWGAWKNAGLAMESLPLPALKKLREKFKSWGCDGKKAKADKQEAWKKVNGLLRQGG